MELSTLVNILAFSVSSGVAIYFLRKQHLKERAYFGKPVKLTRSQKLELERRKKEYMPIPKNEKLPSVKKDGFALEDVEKLHADFFLSYRIPTRQEKAAIKTGDLVKLKFMDGDEEVERMWVEVMDFDRPFIRGILRNDSFSDEDLKEGRVVWFHSNHVLQINASE